MQETSVKTLARLSSRGLRSGIGLHGFGEGGFLIDAERPQDQDMPTKVIRSQFPASWSIMVVIPDFRQGLHGREELNAFRSITAIPDATTTTL